MLFFPHLHVRRLWPTVGGLVLTKCLQPVHEKLLVNRDVWLLNPGNMLAGLGSPIARDPLRLRIFAKCVSLL